MNQLVIDNKFELTYFAEAAQWKDYFSQNNLYFDTHGQIDQINRWNNKDMGWLAPLRDHPEDHLQYQKQWHYQQKYHTRF